MSSTPQSTPAGPVVLVAKQDGIATLVMNRSDRLNALNTELAVAVNEALGRLAEDSNVNVVVITGAGRAFCAGGDLGSLGKSREAGTIQEVEPLLRAGMQMVLKMRTMPQPVIAAVNGVAAGAGMNIALAADIRIAAEEAKIAFIFVKVGLAGTDMGATYLLPRVIGLAKATELLMTGDFIEAQEAERIGLYNRVVPRAQLETITQEFAEKLARGPSLGLAKTKEMLNREMHMGFDSALEAEAVAQALCMQTADFKEAHAAFLEKREAKFK